MEREKYKRIEYPKSAELLERADNLAKHFEAYKDGVINHATLRYLIDCEQQDATNIEEWRRECVRITAN